MKMDRRTLLGAIALSPLGSAMAARWPDRPIRWIVPFAAGGATDVFSRVAAERLAGPLGQSLVVDNLAGAAGVIGLDRLHRAAPDGYTLGTIPNSLLTMSPFVSSTPLPYDPLTAFSPIGGIASFQYVVAVNANSKIRSMAELIELGKKDPGKLTFGTTGVGTGSNLAAVLISKRTGATFTDIPYKGASAYTADLLGGQVDFIIDPVGGSANLIAEGKLRGLATTGARRNSLLPTLPPVADTIAGYDHTGWFGLYGPRGLSADIVRRVVAELHVIQKSESYKASLLKLGYEPLDEDASQLTARTNAETGTWRAILTKPVS